MRWFRPDYNDVRIIRRFAFFPIRAGDEWRWLEPVTIRQEYWGHIEGWGNEDFIDKRKGNVNDKESEVTDG